MIRSMLQRKLKKDGNEIDLISLSSSMLRAHSNMKDSEPVLFKSTDTIFQYLKRHSDSVSMNIKKFGVQYLMSNV